MTFETLLESDEKSNEMVTNESCGGHNADYSFEEAALKYLNLECNMNKFLATSKELTIMRSKNHKHICAQTEGSYDSKKKLVTARRIRIISILIGKILAAITQQVMMFACRMLLEASSSNIISQY